MPQHLTPACAEELGPDAEDIHNVRLHRLANLTLTGYNPSLSDHSFTEKRDAKEGGYLASGLKMNQKIALKDSWGLPEPEERSKEMVTLSSAIWAYPQTGFCPAQKEFDSCTLDDEIVEVTGRDIVRYSYQNIEQSVSSWIEMFEHVVSFFHQKDRSILTGIAHSSKGSSDLRTYVSSDPDDLRRPLQLDDSVYVEKPQQCPETIVSPTALPAF